ncbi:MAG: hypothetical protein AAFV93_14975, partial [Chloroflexota bacterium]
SYLAILYFSLPQIGAWVSLLAFVLLMAVIPIVGGMWGLFSSETDRAKSDSSQSSNTEKRKREQLDAVLRDLSDEDLVRLKRRLEDGIIDDEVLYDRMTLSDDGELIPHRQQSD